MGKDSQKKSESNSDELAASALAAPAVKAAPAVAPPPVVSFDRWFATTGRPQHHKAGMRAYASTNGKKTVAAWNAVFAGY